MLAEKDLTLFEKCNKEDGWLGYAAAQILIEEIRTLQQQNAQMKEALSQIKYMPSTPPAIRAIADKSLQGGSSHDN